MKNKLIKKIISLIPLNENTILSEWNYLDGIGGYLIRKDGEIFTTGDDGAQILPMETYGHLNQLEEKELNKILANIMEESDFLNDMKASPDFFPYEDTAKIVEWSSK